MVVRYGTLPLLTLPVVVGDDKSWLKKRSNIREILKIINNVFYELIVHKIIIYYFIFMITIIMQTYGS